MMTTTTEEPLDVHDAATATPPRRIAVVGTSGVGKTTLSRSISRVLGIPHIELDALHWGPDWTPTPEDELRKTVDVATRQPAWVCDGNYILVRDLIWSRADTLVWLDYSFSRTFWRVLRRTVRRAYSQEELFSGNRESWKQSFASRDSILWWMISTWRRRRREFLVEMARPENAHLDVRIHRVPAETRRWLEALEDQARH